MKVAALPAAALAVAFGSVGALAHGPADPRLRYEAPALQPRATLVTTQISPPVVPHLPPQVRVHNATGKDLTLNGQTNEPFLRIGPAGTFGNLRSPFLGPALDPKQPAAPSPGSGPLWRKLSTATSFRWYERRAAYAGHAPARIGQPQILSTWIVPGVLGSTSVRLVGQIRWRPVFGNVVPRILEVSPPDPKVIAKAIPGPVPAIELRNTSGHRIQITGRDGRPFGRIGPDGVEINLNSATYRDTRSLPPAASATVAWQKQKGQAILVWLERRAAYPGDPPQAIQTARKEADLKTWTIPGAIGGQPFEIRGKTVWVPAGSPAPLQLGRRRTVWPFVLLLTGIAVATAAGVALARSRRNA